MPTMHDIRIRAFAFEPDTLECSVGDSIVWINEDDTSHTATATNGEFDTDEILGSNKSEPQVILGDVDHSGISYFCRYHEHMRGWVTVRQPHGRATPAAARSRPLAGVAAVAAFDRTVWARMAEIIVGCWVHDMADDFEHALANTTGEDHERIAAAWGRLKEWWSASSGASLPFTDKVTLVSLPRSVLEPFGRRLNAESASLGGLVRRHPNPQWPETGQSRDPFGKAITIFDAEQAAAEAFNREIRYASTAFRIQTAQDMGATVTQEMIDRYNNAKAAVTPGDYLRPQG
jgi:hypothetical protein